MTALLLRCQCGARIIAPPETIGKQAKCERCGNRFEVPSPEGSNSNLNAIPRSATLKPTHDSPANNNDEVHSLRVKSIVANGRCPDCNHPMDHKKLVCK